MLWYLGVQFCSDWRLSGPELPRIAASSAAACCWVGACCGTSLMRADVMVAASTTRTPSSPGLTPLCTAPPVLLQAAPGAWYDPYSRLPHRDFECHRRSPGDMPSVRSLVPCCGHAVLRADRAARPGAHNC